MNIAFQGHQKQLILSDPPQLSSIVPQHDRYTMLSRAKILLPRDIVLRIHIVHNADEQCRRAPASSSETALPRAQKEA
jgi:hypothetical protein